MSFAQQELPPIFQKIITAIEENQGKMTTDEFKTYLQYRLKYTNKDVKKTRKWLEQQNYIDIEFCKQNKRLIKLL